MPDIDLFPRGVPGRDDRIDNDRLARLVQESKAPHAMWASDEDILRADKRRWNYDLEERRGTLVHLDGKVFLGELNEQLIGVKDNRHIITVAGTRAGKGVSTIIPNLVFYPGSILVIDPKGENAKRTASRRGHGGSAAVPKGLEQDVVVLDPFGESKLKATHHFNPLDMIDPDSPEAIDDAALIAEALIIQEPGEGRHFTAGARNLLRGLILAVRLDENPDNQNLCSVRRMLTQKKMVFKNYLKDMAEDPRCDGAISRAANSLLGKDIKERSGVISTAIEQTDFLDSKLLADCLRYSDNGFRLGQLKQKPTTLYLCLPARYMATHSRWLRIIINLAVAAMEKEPTRKDQHRVLFIMDEFAVLDHLSSIEKAAGQIAGFDVTLWPVIQDLSQLKSIYKDRWETFLGNAGLMQFFGNHDLTTLEYLSKRLGKTTIAHMTHGDLTMADKGGGEKSGVTIQLQETALMTTDEIARCFSRQEGAQLILWPGAAPIAIDRAKYHDVEGHSYFEGTFEPDDE
jgi:type IV secretion system protein VirD4